MNPSAIYSKSGKGVLEASGKTSLLSRGDRAVLAAVDGKLTLGDIFPRFEKLGEEGLQGLVDKLEHDGFIRLTSGAAAAAPAGKSQARMAAPSAPPTPLSCLWEAGPRSQRALPGAV